MDDISALEEMTDDVTKGDAYLFDVRHATAWANDIQKAVLVGGEKVFRGQNPKPGSAISYWLKSDASSVKISISDVTGREVRSLDGTARAGLNRVQWDLRGGNAAARGGRGGQPEAAPTAQPAAVNPAATPPAAGQQGAQREDRPATATQGGRGARAGRGAQAPAAAAQPQQQAAFGGFGGRGRGGFGPALPVGTYLVKVTVDGKVIGTKTIVVEADTLQQ
jgi:hypothetical protein